MTPAAPPAEPDLHQKITFTGNQTSAATAAAAGIVSTQATTMFPATPHRTADKRRVEPTPIIAPVMVWVVLTGIPFIASPKRQNAAALSVTLTEQDLKSLDAAFPGPGGAA